jgi:thymidylate synthase (FAD)
LKAEIKELLEKEFKCLNLGFVRLIDVMGDDSSIVQAARVSYGKGTKTVNEDRGLIRYLMRHRHTTPFEMVEFKFHIKLPIFVARQWIRHRTANVNEYSGRYSEMKDEFYIPELEQIRFQSQINKQGRSEETLDENTSKEILQLLKANQLKSYEDYKALLDKGLTREIARITLPLSNYTEWYWKIDLHNLFHFLNLRLDSHAQYEIRVYAEAIANIVKVVVPLAWEAFEDYQLNSIYFSRQELKIIKKYLDINSLEQLENSDNLSKRELNEFKEKILKIISL